jgi:hypothetical protein
MHGEQVRSGVPSLAAGHEIAPGGPSFCLQMARRLGRLAFFCAASSGTAAVTPRKHFSLFLSAVCVWAAFWLAGLPSYYQQYSVITMAVTTNLLSVATALAAVFVLRRGRAETRLARAFWLCFYYTVPFAALDALYCGLYLGQGPGFLNKYFIPIALLMRGELARPRTKSSLKA